MRDIERRGQILRLLQRGRTTAGALAAALRVCVRTIYRWVERLREDGYAIDCRRGRRGGFSLAADGKPAPLGLDADEIRSLVVAQAAIEGPGELTQKLLGVLPPARAFGVQKWVAGIPEWGVLGWPTVPERFGRVIEQAMGAGRHVQLCWGKGSWGISKHLSLVQALGLSLRPNGWVLVGFDKRRQVVDRWKLHELRMVNPTNRRTRPILPSEWRPTRR